MKYEIGNRIRKYRKESGLTQEQLAGKINVTKSRVSNWEQGINSPIPFWNPAAAYPPMPCRQAQRKR